MNKDIIKKRNTKLLFEKKIPKTSKDFLKTYLLLKLNLRFIQVTRLNNKKSYKRELSVVDCYFKKYIRLYSNEHWLMIHF